MFYLYEFRDPRTNIPFYVGKGSKQRFKHHKWNHKNKLLDARINEITKAGHEVSVVQVLFDQDENEILKQEVLLIAKYGRQCFGEGTLCNIAPGGNGFRGDHPLKIRIQEKRRENYRLKPRGRAIKQYDMLGTYVRTFEHRMALTESGFTPGEITNMHLCCRGKLWSAGGFRWAYDELKDSTTPRKRVIQIDPETRRQIAEYDSIAAAHKATGIHSGSIGACVRGVEKYNTAGGFMWQHVGHEVDTRASKKLRSIVQFDQNGVEIKTYISASAAERSTGVGNDNIRACCTGRYSQAGGFIWRYADIL